MMGAIKVIRGIALPTSDTHMAGWLASSPAVEGKGTYQYRKFQAAMGRVKTFRGALDIGAHVGTWSRLLAMRFEEVHAFEPVPLHVECWKQNLDGVSNARIHPLALGSETGRCGWHTLPHNTGETWLIPGEAAIVAPLDRVLPEIAPHLPISFIKVDCEGYEPLVLQGAEATIVKWYPTIIVEQDPRYAVRFSLREEQAIVWLRSLGYQVQQQLTCDFILTHPRTGELDDQS